MTTAKARAQGLTAERLRALLSYDQETGVFTRLVSLRGVNAGDIAGTLHKTSGYVYIGVDAKSYRAHRLAWLYMTGEWPVEVDHKDRNRSNNRWRNLREATRSQNNANGKTRVDNSSGHKGINWVARVTRWRAYVTLNSKQHHLGYFLHKEDAITARVAAQKSTFGEFARA